MRIGTRVGPVYVSTGVGRRGSGSLIGALIGLVIGALVVFWPLMLGQNSNGGWHPWVWAIAIPWWILLALAVIGNQISKAEARK
jgi:hypothetical protein